ncbi:type II toxin-antitoxin system HicB family antitoxin [Polymorphospora lycopeni]|uniref:Type II toxin-antitoxin system HicB family antitoxin n=1 Tax=Polymorphospora lycopeni TaxID=3140240 RepID=A0ABV5CL23_9ACTN
MTTYRVIVTREDDAWLADVPALPGTQTFARNLPSLDANVREAIALTEDLPEGAETGLNIAYEYRTGDPTLDQAAAQLRADREAADRLASQVAARTDEMARDLVQNRRMSVRDAAALLAVSPQRISQIAPKAKRVGSGETTAEAA